MEELSNFQYIWEKWITPLVDDLYKQMDEEFQKYCGVQIRELDKIKFRAERYYQNKREEVKKAFYGVYHKGDSQTEHRMDFHKIGAILCRTMMEYKVFSFDMEKCQQYVDDNIDIYDTNWVVKNALINFRLAFYVSIAFLYQSMIFEYSKNHRELERKLREKGCLSLYADHSNQNHSIVIEKKVQESFENCIVLDLAKRDIGNRSFDYLMYAIILYQLEEYNKGLLYDN